MPNGPKVHIHIDAGEIARAISAVSAWDLVTKTKLKNAVNRSALAIQKGAKTRCPVDTGRLRASIKIQPAESTTGAFNLLVGTDVEYAEYVEFGTRRASAQPFLFPASEEERPRFIEEIKKAVQP